MINLAKLAEAVRIKRDALSLSLDGAAEQTGISAPTLSRIENQKIMPELSTYAPLCRWLDVPMEYFFDQAEAVAA